MPKFQNRPCKFCQDSKLEIDYKNVFLLGKFLTRYGKIVPSYYSGTCLKHQKKLSNAIKKARIVALMPFSR